MSIVFVTEKPSVAREYAKVLHVTPSGRTDGYVEGFSDFMNDNVIITWALGHLIGICSPQEQNPKWEKWSKENLPMIPDVFQHKALDSTKKQFMTIQSIYTRRDVNMIYYAGDSGREGIYIQALIRNEIFRNPPANIDERVVWIDSFTDSEIKRGIQQAKPYRMYDNMVASGYARANIDWLIGMNFSRAFSLTTGSHLTTGRVMTPTLAMVVKRQKQIDEFVKTTYFGIKAILNGSEADWEAVNESRFYDSPLLYNESGFLKMDDAVSLIAELNKDRHLTIADVKEEKKTEYAPLLFNQTDLQAFCSKQFKISPSDTLAAAQRLYEAKLTTYPRTSARVLSTAVAAELKKKGYNIPPKYVDDSKIVDHYAIIPTFEGDPSKLSGIDKDIYNAIMKRFMDTMKPPYIYLSVTVTYRHSNNEVFIDRFKNVVQEGWKDLSSDKLKKREIPAKGTSVDVIDFELRNLETSPPTAYTTGTLVTDMEKAGKYVDDEELRAQLKSCGLGTDATRAGIIQKLVDLNYISVDKKQKVAPTEMGKAIIPIIEKYDETLISPVKTAELETNLSAIAEGMMDYGSFMQKITEYVSETTTRIVYTNDQKLDDGSFSNSEAIGKCPKCGADVKKGKFGFYCTAKCGMLVSKIYGKELTENQLKTLLGGKQVSVTMNGRKRTVFPEYVQNDYNGKTFFIWKLENTATAPVSEKKHNCPCCGKELKVTMYGWKCECGFSLGGEICGRKMLESDLEDLISRGETNVYSFISKKGNNFSAKLVLDKVERKTKFEFAE